MEEADKKIAYYVPYAFGNRKFPIFYSANAWWMNESKVHRLLSAFEHDATIREACAWAEISLKQYKYFVDQHPDFTEVRDGYRTVPIILAKRVIVKNLDNPKIAWQWLKKKLPGEFGTPSERLRSQKGAEQERIQFLRIPSKDPEIQAIQDKYNKILKDFERELRPYLIKRAGN